MENDVIDVEKLQYDNDQMLTQLGWLLERVIVKDGDVSLPTQELSPKDMLDSMKELKRLVSVDEVEKENS